MRRLSYKTILPLLLLFFLLSAFVTAALHLVTREIEQYCLNDLRSRLERYVQEKSAAGLITSAGQTEPGRLGGLSFVRLIRGDRQFLYADKNSSIDMEFLQSLDAGKAALWISPGKSQKPGAWVISSIAHESGATIQGGRVYTNERALVLKVKRIWAGGVVGALGVSCLLSVIIGRVSRKPLKDAEAELADIVLQKRSGLLKVRDGDMGGLYELLNKLILHNNQLIKEMQESLDNVAHDLRTPMTRLRSMAEYGLQENDPEMLAEALSDCLEESERVLAMLGIMMSVAEAESGTMLLNRDTVNLQETILDVVNLYEYVAEEKHIQLEVNVDDSVMIHADKTRITQVWANILDNAIKYSGDGSMISVAAVSNGENHCISFEDEGMGISPNEIERIWDRLFRGDRSRSQQGLGLGLNYVKAVVEAHGGTVSVTSSLGEGARFAVLLPVV